jgi:hypothetical protein
LIGVQSAVETRGDAVHEQQARMSGLIERAAMGLPPVDPAPAPPIPPRHQAAMIAAERHAP